MRCILPLVTLLAACAAEAPLDQAAADAIAVEALDGLVAAESPFRLVRGGQVVADEPIREATPLVGDEDPGVTTTPEDPGFLFLLDLAPRTFFDHPVSWIVVDADDGEVHSTPARWPPLVDAEVPPGLIEALDAPEEEDAPGVVAGRAFLQPAAGLQPVFEVPRLDLQESNAYIVVQGLLPTESLHGDATATGEVGRDFFESYEDALSETILLADASAADLLATIDSAAGEHEVVTVAIIAHGSVDGISVGGVGVTSSQLRAAFQAHPDTTFNLLLGSCHGGSFVDDLDDLANVGAVLTAVDASQGAEPDWDVYTGGPASTDANQADVGSEWFSSMYAAAAEISGSIDTYAAVFDLASSAGIPHSTALLCLAFDGALGDAPTLGLDDDLDFSHFLGGHTPQRACAGM